MLAAKYLIIQKFYTMRQLILILVAQLFSILGTAQINGNGKLTTTTISLEKLTEIDIQFNADIILDFNAKETMTITADENVMNYIGQSYSNGTLTLDQIKWIEPSRNPKITIGTPYLKKVYQGTHSTTDIINVKSEKLWINGNVGKVNVSGECNEVRVRVSGTDVNLRNTKIDYADITVDGRATITLNDVNQLDTDLNRNANIVLLKEPRKYLGNSKQEVKGRQPEFAANPDLKFISFKIKNNSWTRKHFVVVGPKKSGNTFSYGFPMMPGSTKTENWSVGTKVYREGRLGSRELLVTIKAEDEGQVVKLFE